ncbi:hypothetical protein D9619_001743 [Psilocybe cf. subviscida]|uniref:Uncharacterized protein n=1 Tax=Psilocybe cf. subviscida TaxID=2480587 RepID=A0A8H5F2M8_9AGAR|nr:hypothetical protein D9619_001743 [Psilocybe cf. subviscida]
MAFSYRRLFFGGNTFCCCLPVRLGMIVLTTLTCLIAGLLSIIIWFEVSSTKYMSPAERAAFVLAGLSETILFVASILGLVGAIVRKQNFTQIYAYTLYTHFFLNILVIAYFSYEVARATSNTEKVACIAAIKDAQAQQQCTDLLSFATWVYVTIAGTILLLELYGSIIVARYVNQLQREKREARAFRSDTDQAFQLKARDGHQYTKLPDPESHATLPILDPSYLGPSSVEFDPYADERPTHEPTRAPYYDNTTYDAAPPPIDEGYGGGTWTHDGIAQEEKAKLKLRDLEEEARSIRTDEHHVGNDSPPPKV